MPLHCLQWQDSSFEELLDKDGSVTIYTRNLQVNATEMLKCIRTCCQL